MVAERSPSTVAKADMRQVDARPLELQPYVALL